MNRNERMAADDISIDLQAILAAVWRAKRWIVPVVVVTAVAAAVGLSLMPPKYKGEARILIEPREIAIRADQRQPEVEKSLLDQEGVASQVQLLTSRDLARRVIAKENLGDKPEFGPGLVSDLMRAIGLGKDPMRESPEERHIEAFFERLEAYQVEKSRVIQVDYSSSDPDLAAKVANAVVREYLQLQAEAKQKNSTDATRWLESEIKTLRDKVTEAEAKVEAYRSNTELFVATNNNTLIQQQLAELNTQLTNARALKSDAEAKVAQVRKVIQDGAIYDGANEIVSQPLFQRLREREVALKSRIAELSAVYLPGHPQIQTLESQLRDIDAQTRTEARRILGALETDVRVADQRIRELRGQLTEFKAQASRANQEDIQLRALEREAKAQRELLETFLSRFREASARQNTGSQPADARVISEASPPVRPYFPKVVPLTSVITLAVFLLSVTGVVLGEILSGRALRSGSSAPVLPAVAPTPTGRRPEEILEDISDKLAERLDSASAAQPRADVLRRAGTAAALLVRDPDAVPVAEPAAVAEPKPETDTTILWRKVSRGRLIAVVSAVSGAVSHQAALALARTASGAPVQVCLVSISAEPYDTAALVGSADGPGFGDLIGGTASFGDVIHRDRGSRLHVVPPGRRTAGSGDGERSRALILALGQAYDHVVVDVGLLTEVEGWALDLAADADQVVVATAGAAIDAGSLAVIEALARTEPDRLHLMAPPPVGATRAA